MRIRRQKGLTLIGFLIVLSVVIFATYIGMRIGPIYMEYYSVVSAMNGVAKERGAAQISLFEARRKVLDRLYVSYASNNVTEKHIKIVRRNGVFLNIAYEVRKPLLGNLDVVAKFDRTVPLTN